MSLSTSRHLMLSENSDKDRRLKSSHVGDLKPDYRDVERLKVRSRLLSSMPETLVSDQTYSEVKVNTHPDDQFFAMPKGVMSGPEILGALSPTIRKLAPDMVHFPLCALPIWISRRRSVNWIYKSKPLPTVTAGSAQCRTSAMPWENHSVGPP